MARRPRPTLAQVDALEERNRELAQLVLNAQHDRDAAIAEAQNFGRRQIRMRRSLEQYVVALHDFNAGRNRSVNGGLVPNPDRFGGLTGFFPEGIPEDSIQRAPGVVETFGGTPTPNHPDPKRRWYQWGRK